MVESCREGLSCGYFAIGTNPAQHHDLSGTAVREEEIAVRRGANQTRLSEALCVHLHLETFGR